MKRFLILVILLYYAVCIFLLILTSFTDSNLPIVLINTDGGVEIPDSPRVFANMKIIYRGAGSTKLCY